MDYICASREALQTAKNAITTLQERQKSALSGLINSMDSAISQLDAVVLKHVKGYLNSCNQQSQKLLNTQVANLEILSRLIAAMEQYYNAETTSSVSGVHGSGDTHGHVAVKKRSLKSSDATLKTSSRSSPKDAVRLTNSAGSDFLATPYHSGTSASPPDGVVSDVKLLNHTSQTMNTITSKAGETIKLFDNPEMVKKTVPHSQGNNSHNFWGTCALAQTAIWLIIGGYFYNEDAIVSYCKKHGLCTTSGAAEDRGGISPSALMVVWKHFGLDPVMELATSTERIADEVAAGKAVTLSVRAETLWGKDKFAGKDYTGVSRDTGADHMISVISFIRGSDGRISHFIISDTGRGFRRDVCREVPVDDLMEACSVDRGVMIYSKKPIR